MKVKNLPVREKLTPPALAQRWGISPDKVHSWIRPGQLRAINASAKLGGRARYLIDTVDIAAFERQRANCPPAPTRRTKNSAEDVIHFF